MNLLRRIISIFLIALLIVAVLYGFLWLKAKSFSALDPVNAIPDSFVVSVKTKNYLNFEKTVRDNKTSIALEKSVAYPSIKSFYKFLSTLDNLRKEHESFHSLFKEKACLSLHYKNGKLNFLFSINAPGDNAVEELMKILNVNSNIEKLRYENQVFYHLKPVDSTLINDLSFFEGRGVFVASNSGELLKESIRNIHSGVNVFKTEKYHRISETAGKDVLANIYLNYEKISEIDKIILSDELFKGYNNNFSASALDLEVFKDKIILNGFTSLASGLKISTKGYKKIEGDDFMLLNQIPADIAMLRLEKGKNFISADSNKNEVENKFVSDFSSLLDNEKAEIIGFSAGRTQKISMFRLKSGGNTWKYLTEDAFAGKGITQRPEVIEFQIDNKTYSYAYLENNPISKSLSINESGDLKANYFMVYKNSLIFAEKAIDLKDLVYQLELGNTLTNNDYFLAIQGNFASNSNVFTFVYPSLYFNYLMKKLQPSTQAFFLKDPELWKKFDAFSFQSTRANDLYYFRLFFNYPGQTRERVKTVWKSKLNASSSFKPAIVRNHNTGDKEILIQDDENTIYLLSSKGNILWKKKLESKILGDIIQVDYFKNGKLQYLFNTTKKLYLIDRNGNSVERFPIIFRSDACAGIELFDYDNTGDWRIPVPNVEKDIVMYNREGKVISGWRYRKSDHLIDKKLLHMKVEGKDFIISRDEYQLYFSDRRGRNRIQPEKQIHFSKNNPLFPESHRSLKDSRVLASDEKGNVYAFYLNEKVEKLLDNKLSEEHFFLAENLTGDSKKEFIFVDNGSLSVYNQSGSLLFEYILSDATISRPVLFQFGAEDKKIGLVATKTGKIYLFNNDGTIYNGFPLTGSGLFSISSFPDLKDRFNLIVSNKDNFIYNYSVK